MNPLVERLGWVLVNSLWQFALVALLAAVARRAMRRSSSATRYGVLVAVMAVMVGIPLATWLCQTGDVPSSQGTMPSFKPWQQTMRVAEGEDRVIDVPLESDKAADG